MYDCTAHNAVRLCSNIASNVTEQDLSSVAWYDAVCTQKEISKI